MKNFFFIIVLLMLLFSFIQPAINPDSLMRISNLTTAEINSIVGVQEGSIVYDTDRNRMLEYTNTGWSEMLVDSNVYLGSFTIKSSGSITISDVPFQPSQVSFVAHANIESDNIAADNGVGNNARGISNSYGTSNGFARNNGGSIVQQSIYVGGHGNSINDISRYSSSSNCVGIRYGDQNGSNLGIIEASLTNFTTNGFTVNATYTNGDITINNTNPVLNVQPADVNNEAIVVLFTAYK
ncbi:hypothetical protein [Nonlabens sp. SY33080]|uniref:hypothetical protein n=1 Tax=Nonlabens sp. SY33080 TaxID=2719911 RepID=UPI001428A8B8|nr:hypothetical protein [Nonlabens sp. SY33080]